jgi:hypothetical protein
MTLLLVAMRKVVGSVSIPTEAIWHLSSCDRISARRARLGSEGNDCVGHNLGLLDVHHVACFGDHHN